VRAVDVKPDPPLGADGGIPGPHFVRHAMLVEVRLEFGIVRVREMRSAKVERRGDFVEVELVAEGFLRGLARSIAGALVEGGRGRKPPEWVGEVLAARDRNLAPRTAPAGGLTLVEVIY